MSMIHSSINAAGDWQYASTSDIADTNAVEVVAARTGYRHRVCAIQCNNTDTAVDTLVQIRTGTTVLWTGLLPRFTAATPGGNHIGDVFSMPLIGDVSANINVILITTSAQVRVSLQGVTQKAS